MKDSKDLVRRERHPHDLSPRLSPYEIRRLEIMSQTTYRQLAKEVDNEEESPTPATAAENNT